MSIPQYTPSSTPIKQTAHGLVVGNVVRHNGTAYVKSKADTAANAAVIGIVVAAPDVDNFRFVDGGLATGLSGLTAGETYYLSPATAGLLTATPPSTVGQISKPLLFAVSTTSGFFFNWRGMEITAAAVSLYLEDIGDGTTNPITVTHGLGTKDVTVTVRENSNDEEVGVGTIDHATADTVVLTFSTAPTTDQYRVKVAL